MEKKFTVELTAEEIKMLEHLTYMADTKNEDLWTPERILKLAELNDKLWKIKVNECHCYL